MSPFVYFAEIRCVRQRVEVRPQRDIARAFDRLGIAARVRDFQAVVTPGNPLIGRALTHRRIVCEAAGLELASVLVLEDDLLFLDRTLRVLAAATEALAQTDWTLCYLGGCHAERPVTPTEGSSLLGRASEGSHSRAYAVAYSARIYSRVLQDLPDDISAMDAWLATNRGLDDYLRGFERAVAVIPPVATSPQFLPFEAPADQFHFTL